MTDAEFDAKARDIVTQMCVGIGQRLGFDRNSFLEGAISTALRDAVKAEREACAGIAQVPKNDPPEFNAKAREIVLGVSGADWRRFIEGGHADPIVATIAASLRAAYGRGLLDGQNCTGCAAKT